MTEGQDQPRIGWLGTGRMGATLVRRLLAAGCDVTVCNRTTARARPLAAAGARLTGTPAGLAGCDLVFVTVGTPQDLIDSVTGPAGLTAADAAPRVVADCSTVSPGASRQVRAALAARGTDLLAAPIMGNPRVAAAGQLTFAVSGPRAAYETVLPVLRLLGTGATYVGDDEAARSVKLCHNLFLGIVAQSLAEVTVLAQRAGVSRQDFLACLNASVMGSLFTRYKSPALVNLDFEPTFTSELLRKDFDLGLGLAREHEVPMPVASLVHQLVQSLVGHGHGGDDFAALLLLQAQSAGLELTSENAVVLDGLEPGAAAAADSSVFPAPVEGEPG
ncbi:MAG TPA: NAD(P)-dependent oxidoreductase [Streptosporangiaceae bacterium]|jgi:3-hydroxyisobutyrate dehydrogenase-like beta-hydroxyacid dehydrogenase